MAYARILAVMDSQLDTIRVGKKEVWAYVTACITSFNSGCKELTIRARGSAISKAVDVVNSLERSFLRKVEVKEIKISSDELDDGNKKVWKSAIEIKIAVS